MTKIRDDKTWETATNVDELKVLFKNSKQDTDVSLLLKDYKASLDDPNDASTSRNSEISLKSPKKRKLLDDNGSTSSTGSSMTDHSPKKKHKRDINKNEDVDESFQKKLNSSRSKDSGDSIDTKKKLSPENSVQNHAKRRKVKVKNPLPNLFADMKSLFVNCNEPEIER